MLNRYIKNPKELASDIKELALSGEVNPIMIKAMYDIFSQVMKDEEVKSAILAEADLHDKVVSVNGFTYQKMSISKYSYKHDTVWQEINEKRKEREQLMKNAMKSGIADSDTGEMIPSAIKTSTEFLKRI